MSLSDTKFARQPSFSILSHKPKEGYENYITSRVLIIALRTLAGIGLCAAVGIAGAVGYGAIAFPSALPIILLLVSIAAFSVLSSRSITDYENPEVLRHLKKQALTLDFETVLRRHGVRDVFRYEILSPEGFESLVVRYLSRCRLTVAITFITKIRACIKKYAQQQQEYERVLDKPSLISAPAKWAEETQDLPIEEILSRYDINLLRTCCGFKAEDLESIQIAQRALQDAARSYLSAIRGLQEHFKGQIYPHQDTLERELEEAESAYRTSWDPQRVREIEEAYHQKLQEIEQQKKEKLAEWDRFILRINTAIASAKSAEDKAILVKERQTALSERQKVLITAQQHKDETRMSYIANRRAHALETRGADRVRKQRVQRSHKAFTEQVQLIREERDRELKRINRDYVLRRKEINQEYQSRRCTPS